MPRVNGGGTSATAAHDMFAAASRPPPTPPPYNSDDAALHTGSFGGQRDVIYHTIEMVRRVELTIIQK